MKKLTCEMCGSNNLIKQDGLFGCQNCGTKYSVEEAKKMARDIRINARVYAEEIMSKLETVLKEAMISYQKQDRLVEDCFSQLISALYESKKNLNGEDAN